MRTILIKINKAFGSYEPGNTAKVDCDDNGIPLDRNWRRRLEDAKHDQCCEIVKPEEKPTEKPKRIPKSTSPED